MCLRIHRGTTVGQTKMDIPYSCSPTRPAGTLALFSDHSCQTLTAVHLPLTSFRHLAELAPLIHWDWTAAVFHAFLAFVRSLLCSTQALRQTAQLGRERVSDIHQTEPWRSPADARTKLIASNRIRQIFLRANQQAIDSMRLISNQLPLSHNIFVCQHFRMGQIMAYWIG